MDTPLSRVPNLPCMCASFRRAARVLTQLYDDALRPLGLRTTQFTILQALSWAAGTGLGSGAAATGASAYFPSPSEAENNSIERRQLGKARRTGCARNSGTIAGRSYFNKIAR
jgi:hypothetical protein